MTNVAQRINGDNSSVPVVRDAMTLAQLKDEAVARNPRIIFYKADTKQSLLSQLGRGTELRGSVEYRRKSDEDADLLHVCSSLCHEHSLAASNLLRAPPLVYGWGSLRRRHDVATCNLCEERPFRSCELCDFDICMDCFELESMPRAKMDIFRRHTEQLQTDINGQEMLCQRNDHMEEEYGSESSKFLSVVRDPGPENRNESAKLPYLVCIRDVHRKQDKDDVPREFDSSFCTLSEANQRVEYLFKKEEMFVDEDELIGGHFRYMQSRPDGGGSFTAFVVTSDIFDTLSEYDVRKKMGRVGGQLPKPQSFSHVVRKPPSKHRDAHKKMQFTVWQSCGYGYDGFHSYAGPPDKEFDSSFDNLEEANDRAKFLFYFENPWGLEDEYEIPQAETNEVSKHGFLFLQCRPDDSEIWTVSVIPSNAFDYLNL